ncbi:helix-turn-helix domain-containing protein [Halomonas sp. PAMB 3264]|uniref:helix-turn-helix domain-containing protein n=1 Tax=Halomonas sp. PAMB 3264 TaxID=3075222 RepID=UPI00289FEF73|nr:helix-turn-helix domain-containing protein [Halomonas sp. PAMB 3264]WNL41490.1 helix-turn-helix domain-containing protein [Halomonas sp. PAMB 3264]
MITRAATNSATARNPANRPEVSTLGARAFGSQPTGFAPVPHNGPAIPASAPKRRSIVSLEVNEQALNLTRWEQEYNQCSAGHFTGRVDECCFDGVQVINEYTRLALHQHCAPWHDSLWIALPVRHEGVRVDGQCVERNEVIWRMGSRAVELMTPEHCDLMSMVVPLEALATLAEREGVDLAHLNRASTPRLAIDDRDICWFTDQVTRILREDSAGSNGLPEQETLLHGVLTLLGHAQLDTRAAPSYARRRAVVDRVQAYLKSVEQAPVSIGTLCSVACVSRRTLQYSFESILGISPVQFLRATRLNDVRRELLSQSGVTISDVAANHGFSHFSQFATDYKSLFNERPSDTLKRRLH